MVCPVLCWVHVSVCETCIDDSAAILVYGVQWFGRLQYVGNYISRSDSSSSQDYMQDTFNIRQRSRRIR
jgi:hypothetical protein